MFDYLQKFNALSADLRTKISSPSVMAIITELEDKYKVNLAMMVMKVMIKDLSWKDLPVYFINESGLSPLVAENLTRELKERVFILVADYLGLNREVKALNLDKDIKLLIEEAGIILPSSVLVNRFKNIIKIYLKGIRDKIDTRNTLAKNVKIGGLNLSSAEIDRVLKICQQHKFVDINAILSNQPEDSKPAPRPSAVPEYNLKQAIESGQIDSVKLPAPNKPANLSKEKAKVTLKLEAKISPVEISAPEKLLKLPVGKPAARQRPDASFLNPLKSKVSPVIRERPSPAPLDAKKINFWSKFRIFKKKATNNKLPDLIVKSSISAQKSIIPKTASPTLTAKKTSLSPSATEKSTISKNTSPTLAIKISNSVPKIKSVSKSIPKPFSSRPVPTPSTARPSMHDIKSMPKTMGPIEELKFLNIVNFRRLSKTPTEATDKILAKIKLLEKDGYDKMVAGVLAWRQSPVNRLYLHLGERALGKGLLLKDYIESLRVAGQEYLSLEELEAIVKLNSRLVF